MFILCRVIATVALLIIVSTDDDITSHQFKCPEQFGYFDDPFDCSKYFVCVFGEALHEQCTGGLYFSVDHQTCDWPRNIGCNRAPVVTVTTSTSSSDDRGQLSDSQLVSQSNEHNLTKVPQYVKSVDLTSIDRKEVNYSSINLSPGQSINYDTSNDSLLLDAAASVDRRVGSHFQNQRLNQIAHQYQRSPVQSTNYPHYDVLDSNKKVSSDVVYFDEDRDNESGVNKNSFITSDADKNRYHLSNNDNNDATETHTRDILNANKEDHLTNLPLPTFKVSPVSIESSARVTSINQRRRPFVPPYSGFESTRNLPIRGRSVSINTSDVRSKILITVGRLSDDLPSISENQTQNVNNRVIINHHDTRRRPPKRLELPSLSQAPPPHSSSSSSSSSLNLPLSYSTTDSVESETNSPAYSLDTTTVSTTSVSNSFVLLDRDEESTGARGTLHSQPLYESYDHSSSDSDKYHLSYDDGPSADHRSTRLPSFLSPPEATTSAVTTPSVTVTSTTVASISSQRPPLFNPRHGQPLGLFDYDATEPPVATEAPIRLKKLLRPRKKPPPPPSGYVSSIDESSISVDSSEPVTPKGNHSPDSTLFDHILTAQPIVPIALSNAEKCDALSCKLPDCNCGSPKIPGGLRSKDVPQIVLLTFDDAINDLNWEIYEEIFNSGRKNPNGCPILGTFYVSHEWTDYSQVQTLYSRGHEMASHGVSHSFGEKFTKNQWLKEVNGQRQILNLYGGVELTDVRGMRAPFLQVGGNKQFEMLYEANFTYDSSMPVFENNPPFYPYTLDFALNHECMIAPCPTKSYPGLWEIGMTMWEDLRGGRCSMADACQNPGDSESIYKFLMKNFNRHYKSNRAPFGLFYHSAWFNTDHHRKGFIRFIDNILTKSDVYFVTNWQMIQWMKEPTPLDAIQSFKGWKCDKSPPISECSNPHVCTVKHSEGSRFMKTCQSCPSHYPWVGRV